MKRILLAIVCMAFLRLLCMTAYAATFVDDMNELWNTNFRTYQHLTGLQNPGMLDGMADNTAFSFASASSPSGWVDYRVTGARKISVTLYSHAGTFVHRLDGGRHAMGVTDEAENLANKTLARAGYSPSSRGVYARLDGALCRAYYDEDKHYIFAPTADAPADLIEYGVSVFVSATGSSYRRLPLANTQISFTPGSAFCSETLSAALPPDTAFIRVELNDTGRFPLLDKPGQFADKAYTLYNALASVSLTGENLVFGIPAPVVTLPRPTQPAEPVTEATPPRASSSSRADPKSSAAPSSKFTGVIEPSLPSEKFTGAAGPPPPPSAAETRELPREESREQTVAGPVTYEQPDAVIYQVDGAAAVDAPVDASVGILAYAVVLSGVIVVMLVKPKGK